MLELLLATMNNSKKSVTKVVAIIATNLFSIIFASARARADKQFIVTLTDFTFTPPAEILKQLRSAPALDMGGMNMNGAAKPAQGIGDGAKPMEGMSSMSGMGGMCNELCASFAQIRIQHAHLNALYGAHFKPSTNFQYFPNVIRLLSI